MTPTILDERDTAILAESITARDALPGFRDGDFIRFADGVQRRISYIWRDEHGVPLSVQTSNGGSYYLSMSGYVSMSGSLFTGVKPETLTETNEVRPGSVWFFHHNYRIGGGGVDTTIPCRVFTSSVNAPK